MIAIGDLVRPDARFPGLASVAAVTLYSILFLHAESQREVMGLVLGALVGLLSLARFDWTQRVSSSFAHHPRLLHGAVLASVITVLAVFHDQHYPLLMLATVLLYIVMCLGLNIQFGYAGVLNFAGAAFFGVGAYTSAVLAAKTGVPHLFIIVIGGGLAALIGSLLILPLLRTRGHYAALITIAFSLLFKTLIEVSDALADSDHALAERLLHELASRGHDTNTRAKALLGLAQLDEARKDCEAARPRALRAAAMPNVEIKTMRRALELAARCAR